VGWLVGEHAKREIRCDPVAPRQSEIDTVAGPWVFGRIGDQAGADRIEMNVTDKRYQVGIGIHKHRVVTSFEKVASGIQARLHLAGVLAGNSKNELAQRRIGNLYQHMNMIGHPAEGVNPRRQAMNCFANHIIQPAAIGLGEKDWLPMVAAQGDVIETAWDMQSEPARHRSNSTVIAMGARA
jgi:hypothetical protein